jgi:hypothetical protein
MRKPKGLIVVDIVVASVERIHLMELGRMGMRAMK